jgi:hypothetical protein
MNLGIFANFSDFFFKDDILVLINTIAPFMLFAGYG